MKKQLFAVLLFSLSAFGQCAFSPPQTALKTVNGLTQPLSTATITVCAAGAAGIPCSPASVPIYKDSACSAPLSNPFVCPTSGACDSNGNFQFAAAPGTTYTVTVTGTGFSGSSAQVTLPTVGTFANTVTTSPGPGVSQTIAQQPSTSFTVTGPSNFQNLNGILFANEYGSVEAAGAACGVNKCIVVVPSTYAGTDCATTYRANVTYVDYRGTELCELNSTTFNYATPANTYSMVRHQMRVTGALPSGGGSVALYPITEAYNATVDGTQNVDGMASDAQLLGTLTGTLPYLLGGEFVSFPRSTGGTVSTGGGIQGYYTSALGSTTAISLGTGGSFLGCHNVLGAAPTVCSGAEFSTDSTGTSENYSARFLGLGLLRYSLLGGLNAAGLDAEDTDGSVHRFLYVASDHSSNLQAVNAVGWNISDNNGNARVKVTSSGLNSITANYLNGVLKDSATAPTISSGFGTTPSVVNSNGTSAFTINVGTGGTATNGVIGLPTASHGWACHFDDVTTQSSTVFVTKQIATSTTSATIANFNTAGAQAAWTASDVLVGGCVGY